MSGRHVESITRLEDLVLAVDGEGQFSLAGRVGECALASEEYGRASRDRNNKVLTWG
jgi:hypothetical protein